MVKEPLYEKRNTREDTGLLFLQQDAFAFSIISSNEPTRNFSYSKKELLDEKRNAVITNPRTLK